MQSQNRDLWFTLPPQRFLLVSWLFSAIPIPLSKFSIFYYTSVHALPSYILHYIVPLADNPQLPIYTSVRVLLCCSPSIITDIPLSAMEFLAMLRTCRLQFFNNLPTQLAPAEIINNLTHMKKPYKYTKQDNVGKSLTHN